MEYSIITLFALVIIILICVFLHMQNNIIDITKYELKSDKFKRKVRIIQLSDLHSKPFKKVLNKVKGLKPDIICITGDFINDRCKNKDKMIDFAKELVKTARVYYITGNHERRLDNFEELMEELTQTGFIVLLNRVSVIKDDGYELDILGLDENQADFEDYKARKNGTFVYKDMSPYFKELENGQGFKLVLSHFPENFMEIKEMNYSQYDFDLQLSGHAHGGQFRLPFIGPVYSPGQGIRPKYAQGSFGTKPMMIVSRGLGNAEFPFRLFNHPEINVVDIN